MATPLPLPGAAPPGAVLMPVFDLSGKPLGFFPLAPGVPLSAVSAPTLTHLPSPAAGHGTAMLASDFAAVSASRRAGAASTRAAAALRTHTLADKHTPVATPAVDVPDSVRQGAYDVQAAPLRARSVKFADPAPPSPDSVAAAPSRDNGEVQSAPISTDAAAAPVAALDEVEALHERVRALEAESRQVRIIESAEAFRPSLLHALAGEDDDAAAVLRARTPARGLLTAQLAPLPFLQCFPPAVVTQLLQRSSTMYLPQGVLLRPEDAPGCVVLVASGRLRAAASPPSESSAFVVAVGQVVFTHTLLHRASGAVGQAFTCDSPTCTLLCLPASLVRRFIMCEATLTGNWRSAEAGALLAPTHTPLAVPLRVRVASAHSAIALRDAQRFAALKHVQSGMHVVEALGDVGADTAAANEWSDLNRLARALETWARLLTGSPSTAEVSAILPVLSRAMSAVPQSVCVSAPVLSRAHALTPPNAPAHIRAIAALQALTDVMRARVGALLAVTADGMATVLACVGEDTHTLAFARFAVRGAVKTAVDTCDTTVVNDGGERLQDTLQPFLRVRSCVDTPPVAVMCVPVVVHTAATAASDGARASMVLVLLDKCADTHALIPRAAVDALLGADASASPGPSPVRLPSMAAPYLQRYKFTLVDINMGAAAARTCSRALNQLRDTADALDGSHRAAALAPLSHPVSRSLPSHAYDDVYARVRALRERHMSTRDDSGVSRGMTRLATPPPRVQTAPRPLVDDTWVYVSAADVHEPPQWRALSVALLNRVHATFLRVRMCRNIAETSVDSAPYTHVQPISTLPGAWVSAYMPVSVCTAAAVLRIEVTCDDTVYARGVLRLASEGAPTLVRGVCVIAACCCGCHEDACGCAGTVTVELSHPRTVAQSNTHIVWDLSCDGAALSQHAGAGSFGSGDVYAQEQAQEPHAYSLIPTHDDTCLLSATVTSPARSLLVPAAGLLRGVDKFWFARFMSASSATVSAETALQIPFAVAAAAWTARHQLLRLRGVTITPFLLAAGAVECHLAGETPDDVAAAWSDAASAQGVMAATTAYHARACALLRVAINARMPSHTLVALLSGPFPAFLCDEAVFIIISELTARLADERLHSHAWVTDVVATIIASPRRSNVYTPLLHALCVAMCNFPVSLGTQVLHTVRWLAASAPCAHVQKRATELLELCLDSHTHTHAGVYMCEEAVNVFALGQLASAAASACVLTEAAATAAASSTPSKMQQIVVAVHPSARELEALTEKLHAALNALVLPHTVTYPAWYSHGDILPSLYAHTRSSGELKATDTDVVQDVEDSTALVLAHTGIYSDTHALAHSEADVSEDALALHAPVQADDVLATLSTSAQQMLAHVPAHLFTQDPLHDRLFTLPARVRAQQGAATTLVAPVGVTLPAAGVCVDAPALDASRTRVLVAVDGGSTGDVPSRSVSRTVGKVMLTHALSHQQPEGDHVNLLVAQVRTEDDTVRVHEHVRRPLRFREDALCVCLSVAPHNDIHILTEYVHARVISTCAHVWRATGLEIADAAPVYAYTPMAITTREPCLAFLTTKCGGSHSDEWHVCSRVVGVSLCAPDTQTLAHVIASQSRPSVEGITLAASRWLTQTLFSGAADSAEGNDEFAAILHVYLHTTVQCIVSSYVCALGSRSAADVTLTPSGVVALCNLNFALDAPHPALHVPNDESAAFAEAMQEVPRFASLVVTAELLGVLGCRAVDGQRVRVDAPTRRVITACVDAFMALRNHAAAVVDTYAALLPLRTRACASAADLQCIRTRLMCDVSDGEARERITHALCEYVHVDVEEWVRYGRSDAGDSQASELIEDEGEQDEW